MEDRVIESIKNAEKILVGVGEFWNGQGEAAIKGYEAIEKLLADKDYYIISLCEDGVIETTSLDQSRVVTPNDENDDKWNAYNEWLGRTLNKNICILELGVGLKYPTVVRWPFEKIAFFNKKAIMYRVHKSLYQSTEELGDKCIGIKANPLEFVL